MKLINDFTQGKMDKEISGRLMPKGVYRDLLNGRISSSDDGNVGSIQNIVGTKNIDTIPALPDGFVVIGMKHFEDKLYYIATNNTFTTIGEYNKKNDVHEYLFQESDLFELNIHHYIYNIEIIQNMMIFCDFNHSSPYKINISLAKAKFEWLSDNPINITKEAQTVTSIFESPNFPKIINTDTAISNIIIDRIQGTANHYTMDFDITQNDLITSIPKYINLSGLLGDETLVINQEVISDYFKWANMDYIKVNGKGLGGGSIDNEHHIIFYSSILPTFTSSGLSNVVIKDVPDASGGLNKCVLSFTVPNNTGSTIITHKITLTIYDGSTVDFNVTQSPFMATFEWNGGSQKSITSAAQDIYFYAHTNQELSISGATPHINNVKIGDVDYIPGLFGEKYIKLSIDTNTDNHNRNIVVQVKSSITGNFYPIEIKQLTIDLPDIHPPVDPFIPFAPNTPPTEF